MDRPSAQILRLDWARGPRQPLRPSAPSGSRRPPAHLNAAAGRAWKDIVTAAPPSAEAHESSIEAAAVLLARFREKGLEHSLSERLNSMLSELGVSPLASSPASPEQALAALSRRLRAREAADTLES